MRSWNITVGSEYQASINYIGNLAHTPPNDVLLVELRLVYVMPCNYDSYKALLIIGAVFCPIFLLECIFSIPDI